MRKTLFTKMTVVAMAMVMASSVMTGCGNKVQSASSAESGVEVSAEATVENSEETVESTEEASEETTVEATEETTTEATEQTTVTLPVEEAKPAETSATSESESASGYEVEDMSATMWATGSVNVRKGPATSYDKTGSLKKDQEVAVTGKVKDNGWYRFVMGGADAFVSGKYLTSTKPSAAKSSESAKTSESTKASEAVKPSESAKAEEPSQSASNTPAATPSQPSTPSTPSVPSTPAETPSTPSEPSQPSAPTVNQDTCDHDWVLDYVYIEPDCASAGDGYYNCSKCGKRENMRIPATGQHSYVVIAHEDATCSWEGYNTYECSVCGKRYDEDLTINPNNHVGDADGDGYCDVCCNPIG